MHSLLPSGTSSSSISLFFTVFSLISVLLVLPLGYYTSNKARSSVSKLNEAHIDLLRSRQQEILQTIMSAQKILATLESKIDDELLSLSFLSDSDTKKLDESDDVTSSSSTKSKWIQLISKARHQKELNVKSIGALSDDMTSRLGALVKETESTLEKMKTHDEKEKQEAPLRKAEAERMELDKAKRYVVKWHSGTEGVLTSERFKTAQEATIKYDAVGDVAKKLLSLPASADGSKKNNWLVSRQNGGDNWLNCISNDAEPQPGACKS